MEININIEGYNVNGICVGCLNYNRKMFYHRDLKECFKLIADIEVPDGLLIQVCWECMAAVRRVLTFRDQIINSYNILIGYSQKNTFLDSPEDLTQHATSRLKVTVGVSFEENVVKQEPEAEIEIDLMNTDVKNENSFPKIDIVKEEIDDLEDSTLAETDDFLSQDAEYTASSDEDIKLSIVKEKKEKKEKKTKKVKKKKSDKEKEDKADSVKISRKLLNLPEVVELFTMTEEEMWKVRAEDLASKEFTSLKYRCDDCIIGFNTERLKNDHFNGKHKKKGDNSHRCSVCRAYFLTRDNLAAHRAQHARAYRCTRCALVTSLKRRVAAHACVTLHARHRCHACGDAFSTKSKLSYHRGVCCQEKPQCDCCGKVFANKMTLKYHLKVLPQNKEKPKEKLYIPCKSCNKVFHSKKSLRAHVTIHDGVTYPCPVCGKLFQWKRNLARHARNHRERDAGARHECRTCAKTFASRDCYNNHMRLSKQHVPEDTYAHECTYCGKKFPTKWCLVDHVDWDHLKRIKYQCSVCFKPFKTAKIMVAHMNNIHEGKNREPEGEHLCEICGKSYKTVKRLKGHVWAMHTKRAASKTHKCKLCAATFTWQTSIYKHMKIMHDVKRTKPPRAPPTVKKQENYADLEIANQMRYFQQNIANNLVQNMSHNVHLPPLSVQNIV